MEIILDVTTSPKVKYPILVKEEEEIGQSILITKMCNIEHGLQSLCAGNELYLTVLRCGFQFLKSRMTHHVECLLMFWDIKSVAAIPQGLSIELVNGSFMECKCHHAASFIDYFQNSKTKTISVLEQVGIHTMDQLHQTLKLDASVEIDVEYSELRPLLISIDNHCLCFPCEPSSSSLKKENAFVLDVGARIYHGYGSDSSRVSRAKALDIATRLRKLKSLKPQVILVEESDPLVYKEFLRLIQNSNVIPSVWNEMDQLTYIYQMNSKTRHLPLKITCIHASLLPNRHILETFHTYIIKNRNMLFVWIGKQSRSQDRIMAKVIAYQFKSKCTFLSTSFQDQEHPLLQVCHLVELCVGML